MEVVGKWKNWVTFLKSCDTTDAKLSDTENLKIRAGV